MPAATAWHSHWEAQWIGACPGVVVVETADEEWLLLPGQALLLPSEIRHRVAVLGSERFASLYFDPGALDASTACRPMAVTPLLHEAVLAFLAEIHPGREPASGRVELLARLILEELCLRPCTPLRLPKPANPHLGRVCEHLREHPDDPLDVDACARASGMSRRTFTRRFRQETNESFVAWRRRLRVMHAVKLTAQGETSKRIAGAAGYQSVQALYAEARRALGRSLKSLCPT